MSTNLTGIYYVIRALMGGLVAALVLGWIAMKLAWRVRLVDLPGAAPHKTHARPTAMGGGIALYFAVLFGSIWLGTYNTGPVRATLVAGLIVFLFGILDDRICLPPQVKLLGQALATVILIRGGVSVQIFESPAFFFHGQGPLYLLLDWLVTLFWVVGITNAFNFVDSMDGLAVGLGGMAAGFFVLLTLDAGQFDMLMHSAMLVGICLGLYLYNSPPAMMFLGDSGAQTMGFILAVLAIAYRPQDASQLSSWFVPVILLGVPIFDTLLIIVSRLRRHMPIYAAARDHTYHRLVNLLEAPNRAVLVMQFSALLLSCLAILALPDQPPEIANTVFAFVLLVGAACLLFLEKRGLKT